jgi:hypothetical protein
MREHGWEAIIERFEAVLREVVETPDRGRPARR